MERRHGYGYRREIYERAADRVPRDGRQVETEKKVEKEKPKKKNMDKFVRYDEGADMYHMGMTKFQELAKEAKACYKIGRMVLVNTEILDEYLETFHIVDDDFYKQVIRWQKDQKQETLIKGHWYDLIFNYFKKSLAGVTFEVYAQEDIVSPDGLDTVYYKAGEHVGTIVTDDNGIGKMENLSLGKYYLVESATIEGFVLDSNPIYADLSYIDQDTKVVYAGMDVTNERQKVQITVIKKDAETEEALEGAIFGLYAKEDIVNLDGDVVIKADTQIERVVTGKDGKAVFVITSILCYLQDLDLLLYLQVQQCLSGRRKKTMLKKHKCN